MLILDGVVSNCQNPMYATLLSTVKRILLLVQIIAPIALIISASVGFYKLVQNPDEKNGIKKIINQFIAAVMVFFVPIIMDFVMSALGETTAISSCWKSANETATPVSGTTSSSSDGNKKSIISDPKSYEPGKPNAKAQTKSNN